MINEHDETDMVLEQKRHQVTERLARETRVGWPALAAILMLMIIGTAIVAYLLLETGGRR
jgi:hypothetical protein